jgi:NitT/TauT family transport system substrate-binding protein
MRRIWTPIRLLLLLVVTGGLSCGKKPGGAGVGSTVSEVRLGYFANLTHAQAVLGVSSGDFAKAIAPATLTTKVFNAGPSLIEALLAGQIDIAYVGPGPALNAQAKTHGQGIRVIAAAADNGVVIVAAQGSGIKTLEDLKGKRLATPQYGNTQDVSARHYLKDVLHQSDLNNVVPISNAEQTGMMSRGQIEASWAPEPWGSFLVAQNGAQVVGEEADFWPGKKFNIAVVVTTPDFLSRHPDVVEKVLAVHRAWTHRLQSEPDKHVDPLESALYSLTTKKLPPGVLGAAMKRTRFTDEPLPATFKSLADWSFELGLVQQVPDLTGLIDTTILKKLEAADATQPVKETADASDHSPAR